MADAEAEGVRAAGFEVDMYQYAPQSICPINAIRVPETLPEEVLKKMYAAPKPDIPVASPDTLTQYDAFLFGIVFYQFNLLMKVSRLASEISPPNGKPSGILPVDYGLNRRLRERCLVCLFQREHLVEDKN